MIVYDSTQPMTAAELRAIDHLHEKGRLPEGLERLSPEQLAVLLGCTHERLPHGGPCLVCLPDPEREGGKVPVASAAAAPLDLGSCHRCGSRDLKLVGTLAAILFGLILRLECRACGDTWLSR